MLKISTQMAGVVNCFRRTSAELSQRALLTSVARENAIAKQHQQYISQTSQCQKRFDIQDHFDFDKRVINSDVPVIVNFHAEWCEPCKLLTPKFLELLENSTEIHLAIIDVDTHTDLVEAFQVKAVPAILAFRNGVVIDKFIGLSEANSVDNLVRKLKSMKSS